MSGEMREAMENMLQHRAKSTVVDRTGWTRQQWIDDARALMDDLHGSVQSLVNGHVLALLSQVDWLAEQCSHLESDAALVSEQAKTAALADLCAKVIDVHAEVQMDTVDDRALHDHAVATFRDMLRLLTGGAA